MFKVSVIIPVFNAASFIEKAVESAVHLQEVGEVILIEDGSNDNSLSKCNELSHKYEKVKVLQHPGGSNKGAGASRNLGIKNASFDYISFLDADDFFLEDRFNKTKKVFEKNEECEGVYEAVGVYFNDDIGQKRFSERLHLDKVDASYLTTIKSTVSPENLFNFLLINKYERFSTIGLCLKSNVFKKSGYFNTELRLHQDSELWLRIAYHCKLYAGEINKAVSVRRVHENNRSSIKTLTDTVKYYKAVFIYFETQPISEVSSKKAILRNYLLALYKLSFYKKIKIPFPVYKICATHFNMRFFNFMKAI